MVDEEIIARGTYQEAVPLLRVEPLDASPLARRPFSPAASSSELLSCATRTQREVGRAVCGRGLCPVGLQDYGVFRHLHDHGLDPGPVLPPDRVLGDGRVEPETPPVAFAVVEDALRRRSPARGGRARGGRCRCASGKTVPRRRWCRGRRRSNRPSCPSRPTP